MHLGVTDVSEINFNPQQKSETILCRSSGLMTTMVKVSPCLSAKYSMAWRTFSGRVIFLSIYKPIYRCRNNQNIRKPWLTKHVDSCRMYSP